MDFVSQFIYLLRNLSSLQKLNLTVIVYNKNSNISSPHLQKQLKADIVQSLPNFGRESGTYLYHIINNYDTLANHILFSQAAVEGISNRRFDDWFVNRLEKQFNSTIGYMPLVHTDWMEKYDCGRNKYNNMVRLAELWALLKQTLCPPEKQTIAYRGQFLVSKTRIRKHPLQIYKYFNDLVTADSKHWIHTDPRSPIGKSTPSNPFFGHVIERLWTVLFDCSKSDLLERCNQNDCACFD
ncbi:hypothetical protein I4U23_020515 [Adineta vaga]|nr:hypothetical protein I4U23_020515 [Adineta vaga]